ncbi:MAG: FecR domain-containing protein [Saprospiraceae bacterium]|nr:FecR domain-containing protein [Saprospiraceae bacterium]
MAKTLPPEISMLIAAYLAGEITPVQEQALIVWRGASPANEAAFREMEMVWELEMPQEELQDWDTGNEWEAFLQQTKVTAPEGKVVKMTPKRNWWTLGIAASIVLVIAFFLWPSSQVKMVEIASLQNEQKEVTLPDGSTVWLNENSSISYQEGFEKRDITLSGEAFFDVKRDTTAPFSIHTGDAVTTVLGTSFNVRAYPAEEKVEVTVATGKVSLAEGSKQVLLVPGNKGTFAKVTQSLSKEEKDTQHAMAWKTGVLDFKNESLEDITPVLERLYNMEVKFENPAVGKCRFSGVFENTQPSEIIDVIVYALSLEVHTSPDTPNQVILYGPGCQ